MKRAITILAAIVAVITAFYIGLYKGLSDKPESVKGVYNINIEDTGRAVIVTRLKYIDTENGTLIIHGKPTFNEIER